MPTKQTTDSVTREDVCMAIVRLYMKSGDGVIASEIAALLGVTPQKVARLLSSYPGGTSQYIRIDKTTRTRYSKDYPMMEAGVATMNSYEPTKELLRLMILIVTDNSFPGGYNGQRMAERARSLFAVPL